MDEDVWVNNPELSLHGIISFPHKARLPSSRLLPMRMSMPSKLVVANMVVGSAGIKSPSIVGADGKPRIPE